MSERLTDAVIRRSDAGKRGQLITWDSEIKGFGLRVTNRGAKSFVLDYRINGRQRRMTLGSYPDWSVAAARREARLVRREIDIGVDPMAQRNAARTAPSISDLWERYQQEHLPRKSDQSRYDEVKMWEKLILPHLSKTKITEIQVDHIEQLHDWITRQRGTPVRANRVIASLRKAFNLAIRWEWCKSNPAAGIQLNAEEKRRRYLSPDELRRLWSALDEHPEVHSANAIRLLMLTGARKSEVLRATWDMFDLDGAVWTKPSAHTKQRLEHRVPISAEVVALLQKVRRSSTSRYLFPGKSPNEPLTDIKRTWATVCRAAGLVDWVPKRNRAGHIMTDELGETVLESKPNARIHDLRHSFATLLASSGASLPLIGAMLGHTQVQTTQRYAHLYDEPLRQAANHVGQIMQGAGE